MSRKVDSIHVYANITRKEVPEDVAAARFLAIQPMLPPYGIWSVFQDVVEGDQSVAPI